MAPDDGPGERDPDAGASLSDSSSRTTDTEGSADAHGISTALDARAESGADAGDGSPDSNLPEEGDAASDPAGPEADCSAFIVTPDPTLAGPLPGIYGARWSYESLDAGQSFRFRGVLYGPEAQADTPGLVLSHGRGGRPELMGARLGRAMASWGMTVIVPLYTHAAGTEDSGNLPAGDFGASAANLARAHKARELLGCLDTVDRSRMAAHGHSMGAYLTAQLLGVHAEDFQVASHTAGGLDGNPNFPGAGTDRDVAELIRAPYQIHHGVDDGLPIEHDRALADILDAGGVVYQFIEYDYPEGTNEHGAIQSDPEMLQRVREWYQAHGVLP